uniref:Uncharacterized protein n=1 Tax=Pediastrum duplex TaxID=3105 RepID=A0A2U8GIQ7_PEDDU|nr:hypothetical protein [Pediastrum duplex]AWI68536.1 hypothetical protein [Pediastrum duplex]
MFEVSFRFFFVLFCFASVLRFFGLASPKHSSPSLRFLGRASVAQAHRGASSVAQAHRSASASVRLRDRRRRSEEPSRSEKPSEEASALAKPSRRASASRSAKAKPKSEAFFFIIFFYKLFNFFIKIFSCTKPMYHVLILKKNIKSYL